MVFETDCPYMRLEVSRFVERKETEKAPSSKIPRELRKICVLKEAVDHRKAREARVTTVDLSILRLPFTAERGQKEA